MIEADEGRGSVGSKKVAWWVWVAPGADTRPVAGVACGDRPGATARCPWDALPEGHREGASWSTDPWAAYQAVAPWERHYQARKGEGLTDHVGRFFATARRRCARFVRKTLPFSRKVESHTGSPWFFIHLYNQSRL